ncbi:MAG: tyrosine recombinase XerD [Flavobacteriales bacterium]|nr:tyrosine recombinase XerD [Flavobacteriales bacterium]|tara:strand:- start:56559 stop:57452 length:894 start_codon:yes stop_codon:yes gene_type:complete
MSWKSSIDEFKYYLKVERSLSENSIMAYIRDVNKLRLFSENKNISEIKVKKDDIVEFINQIKQDGISARSQARVISSLKSFYKYLAIEDLIDINPVELIESPKIGLKLPDTLSLIEIDKLISAIDLSSKQGERNRAILEMLYSCGLRVSELVNLKLSNVNFKNSYLKVIGKGHKERLAPIGSKALKYLNLYVNEVRNHQTIVNGNEDFVFINNRGARLSRVMIYLIIQNLKQKIGLNKKIGPHTFRHSFATHLIEGGANLRAVQEMLGHESITTTEIYTHLDNDYLRSNIIEFHPRN